MGTPIVLLLTFLGLVWSEAMESWRRGKKILSCVKHTLKRVAVPPGGRCVDRYAHLLTFVSTPTLSKNPRKAPWLEQRESIDQQTKRAWMLRGGVFVLLLRKIRRLCSLTPSMYLVYLKRGVKDILRARR
jgi:hypothetical protein